MQYGCTIPSRYGVVSDTGKGSELHAAPDQKDAGHGFRHC